jgi:hypothetical protein
VSTLDVGGLHASGASTGGVKFDLLGALAVSRNLGLLDATLGKFQTRALGTLQRRLSTETRRDIQRQYQIPAGRLAKDLRVVVTPLGTKITGYFRGIGLRNFGARVSKRNGVSASIFKGQRTAFPHAFRAPLLGGAAGANDQIVRRQGEKRVMTRGRYAGKSRQPIVVQYGPTAAQMLRKEGRPERLADFALGVLGAEMQRQVQSALEARDAALAAVSTP